MYICKYIYIYVYILFILNIVYILQLFHIVLKNMCGSVWRGTVGLKRLYLYSNV